MEANEDHLRCRFEGILEEDAANYGLHMLNSLTVSMKRQIQYFKPVLPWVISSRTLLTFIVDRHESLHQPEPTGEGHYQLFKAPYPGQPEFDIVLVGLYKLLKSDNVFVVGCTHGSSVLQTSHVSTTEECFSDSFLNSKIRSAELHSDPDMSSPKRMYLIGRSTS